MTFLTERLVELHRHIAHLQELEPEVAGPESLASDLSLHNDVLFSLLTVTQIVIDIAGELSARARLRFEDYTEAVRNLQQIEGFPAELVQQLERLPGFRNVLVHEYVSFDLSRAVDALRNLQPIEEFARIVARREEAQDSWEHRPR